MRSALADGDEMRRRSGQRPRSADKVDDSFDLDMDPPNSPGNAADDFGPDGSRAGNKQAGASTQRSTSAEGSADPMEPPPGGNNPTEPPTQTGPTSPSSDEQNAEISLMRDLAAALVHALVR